MLHYTARLANALGTRGRVSVAVPASTDRAFFDEAVTVIPLRIPPTKAAQLPASLSPRTYLSIREAIRASAPDVIHVVSSHPWNPAVAHGWRGVPVVATLHDPRLHRGERLSPLLATEPAARRAYHKVFVHGDYWRNELIGIGWQPGRVVSIPHGLYDQFTADEPVEEVPGRVLFFGRITPYKGLDVLIRAMPTVRQVIPHAHLLIAGDGPLPRNLPDDDSVVTRQGYIPEEDVAGLFGSAQAVALPYLDASQSGVLTIAYALRRAVVASHVGAIPDAAIDGKSALLIPPGDVDVLASALIRVLNDDDLRARLAEGGYQYGIERLSWERVAERTVVTYREVMDG